MELYIFKHTVYTNYNLYISHHNYIVDDQSNKQVYKKYDAYIKTSCRCPSHVYHGQICDVLRKVKFWVINNITHLYRGS